MCMLAWNCHCSQLQGSVAYASQTLDRREKNYCITRKELLTVVYFLKYFKQYLLARSFKVCTDHAALIWLWHTPETVGQQARWLEVTEKYDFEIQHRPGMKYGNAKALSRRPCPVKSCACRQGIVVAPDSETDSFLAAATIFSAGLDDRHSV